MDQSVFAVIMEAYLHGTSTRKVDDLVKVLGADTGISKSEVPRICDDLDTEVAKFGDRSLAGHLLEACVSLAVGSKRFLQAGGKLSLAGDSGLVTGATSNSSHARGGRGHRPDRRGRAAWVRHRQRRRGA
jgi:hypothetical protein